MASGTGWPEQRQPPLLSGSNLSQERERKNDLNINGNSMTSTPSSTTTHSAVSETAGRVRRGTSSRTTERRRLAHRAVEKRRRERMNVHYSQLDALCISIRPELALDRIMRDRDNILVNTIEALQYLMTTNSKLQQVVESAVQTGRLPPEALQNLQPPKPSSSSSSSLQPPSAAIPRALSFPSRMGSLDSLSSSASSFPSTPVLRAVSHGPSAYTNFPPSQTHTGTLLGTNNTSGPGGNLFGDSNSALAWPLQLLASLAGTDQQQRTSSSNLVADSEASSSSRGDVSHEQLRQMLHAAMTLSASAQSSSSSSSLFPQPLDTHSARSVPLSSSFSHSAPPGVVSAASVLAATSLGMPSLHSSPFLPHHSAAPDMDMFAQLARLATMPQQGHFSSSSWQQQQQQQQQQLAQQQLQQQPSMMHVDATPHMQPRQPGSDITPAALLQLLLHLQTADTQQTVAYAKALANGSSNSLSSSSERSSQPAQPGAAGGGEFPSESSSANLQLPGSQSFSSGVDQLNHESSSVPHSHPSHHGHGHLSSLLHLAPLLGGSSGSSAGSQPLPQQQQQQLSQQPQTQQQANFFQPSGQHQ